MHCTVHTAKRCICKHTPMCKKKHLTWLPGPLKAIFPVTHSVSCTRGKTFKFRLEELYKWRVYPDLNGLMDELNIQRKISWVKAERRADVGHAVVGRQRLCAGESGTPTFVVWQTVIIIHFCSSNCRGFWNFSIPACRDQLQRNGACVFPNKKK